ncbi:hypothetical protein MLK50_25290, partial [Escherichia coli]|nr:hypothetical protein [Escherichia coli]
TGRKLLSAQGATLLRTAMLDYYNQDTTGTSGIVGMGFNNEDSITDLREGSFKMPDGTTFSDPVGNVRQWYAGYYSDLYQKRVCEGYHCQTP